MLSRVTPKMVPLPRRSRTASRGLLVDTLRASCWISKSGVNTRYRPSPRWRNTMRSCHNVGSAWYDTAIRLPGPKPGAAISAAILKGDRQGS